MTAAHDGPRAGALRRTVVVAQAAPVIAPYGGENNGKVGHLCTGEICSYASALQTGSTPVQRNPKLARLCTTAPVDRTHG